MLRLSMALAVIFLLLQQATAAHYPCAYVDTVNITGSLRLRDGSYSFAGIVIPANLTAEYHIKVIDGIEYGAERHMRGCICQLKPCITFCCPHGSAFDVKRQNCTPIATGHAFNALPQSFGSSSSEISNSNTPGHIELTQLNGSVRVVSIPDTFVIRYELGCKHKIVERDEVNFWKWDLYANGSLLRDGKLWTNDEYCFTPLEYKKAWSLAPLACMRFQRGFRVFIFELCTILAIIINVVVVLLLVWIRKVRKSNYGVTVIFYLISIVFGYAGLVYLSIQNKVNRSQTACRSIGFATYFFLLLSYLFLNIISWEFWRIFALKQLGNWQRKLVFGLAVLLAFVLQFGVKCVQDSDLPQYLKAGIGESVCWFDVRLSGILFYYYLPILLSLAFSIFCCAKSYMLIWRLPTDRTDLSINLNINKSLLDTFTTYLVCVFGITMREVIVWIIAHIRERFFIIDFWTSIFVLGLAIVGFICFISRNKLAKSWWRPSASKKPDDFIGVSPASNRLSEFERCRVPDDINDNDNVRETALT